MESQSESETQCQTENDNILLASLLSSSKSQENLSQDTLVSVNQDASSSKVRSTKRASAANVAMVVQQLIEGNKKRASVSGGSSIKAASTTASSAASTTSSTSERETSPGPSGEKRPRKLPIRKGIIWKVGERIEASDHISGCWYSAKIVSVDEVEAKIMIHFENWSKKFDKWIPCESESLRPCKDKPSKDKCSDKKRDFRVGDDVLARWSDAKMYPGKIANIHSDGTCFVVFSDGYRKKVKLSNVNKLPPDYDGVMVPPSTSSQNTSISSPTTDDSAIILNVASPNVSASHPLAKKEFTIREDHNEYKCECGKGFRKDSLLQQHIKHYHKEKTQNQLEKLSPKKDIHELNEQIMKIEKDDKNVSQDNNTVNDQDKIQSIHIHNVEEVQNDQKLLLKQTDEPKITKNIKQQEKQPQESQSQIESPQEHQKVQQQQTQQTQLKLATQKSEEHQKPKVQIKKKSSSNSKVERKKMVVKLPMNIVKKENLIKPIAIKKECETPKEEIQDMKFEESDDSMPKQKRKYVRKALPIAAVRKSQRSNEKIVSTFIPLTPTTISSYTIQTPEEKPIPNTKLPFWDARTMAEIHESEPEELVNCMCDLKEESGLMVQCEVCQFWQHGYCMNFESEHQVPDGYVCFACKNPRLVRPSQQYDYTINAFLKKGVLPNIIHSANNIINTSSNISNLSTLLAATLDIQDVLVGLQHKINFTSSGNKSQEDILRSLESGSMKLIDWTLNNEDSSQSTIIENDETTSQIIVTQDNIQFLLDEIGKQVTVLEEQNGINNSDESESNFKDEIKLLLNDLRTCQIISESQTGN